MVQAGYSILDTGYSSNIENQASRIALIALSSLLMIIGCSDSKNSEATKAYTYKVVRTYPHDPNAFTQGLVFDNGLLYEGTGLYGSSTLREVELETGRILQMHELPVEFFGEGITIYKDNIIQLTYKSNIGFVYDKDNFELLQSFNYTTEGWGITHDGKRLIMSDGSSTLYFLDPETLEQIGSIRVLDNDMPIGGLNELEYVKGRIFANVWPTERIIIIEPQMGQVIGWVYMDGLLNQQAFGQQIDVLNGIAYDAEGDRLFVTGKLWPRLFEIKLVALR
jgi:glutamine cyclotransferase